MIRLAILITLAGMAAPTDGAGPNAELRLLRATVKMQAAQIARLKARIIELEAVARRPTTRPGKAATTKPAGKATPAVKILSVSDLEAVGRRVQSPKLTRLQREPIRKSVLSRWTSLSVVVWKVTRGGAGTARVYGKYESPKRIALPAARGRTARPQKGPPALQLEVVARLRLDRAMKIDKGAKLVIAGKILSFDVRGGRRYDPLRLAIELDATQPPPPKGQAP